MNNCGWVKNGGKCMAKRISSCKELSKTMIGTRDGVIFYNEQFRIDFESMCYKASQVDDLRQENKKLKQAEKNTYETSQEIIAESIKENQQLKDNWNKLKEWLEEEIYNIEPKGTAINYNCEYDSEEDYINAMKERSKLITLKRVLIKLQEIEGGMNE